MRIAIVSVAWNQPYLRGIDRMVAGLDRLGVSYDRRFHSELRSTWPLHSDVPYGFKHHALRDAEKDGYDVAIWCDANTHFVKDPKPMVDRIADQGYWICTQGWNVGQWCTDDALKKLEITRKDAFSVTMVCAAVYGLRFSDRTAQGVLRFLEQHEAAMPGPWTNKDGEASYDDGVRGHRHDQTVLSMAAYRLGLMVDRPPCLLAYAGTNHQEGAVVLKEGIS